MVISERHSLGYGISIDTIIFLYILQTFFLFCFFFTHNDLHRKRLGQYKIHRLVAYRFFLIGLCLINPNRSLGSYTLFQDSIVLRENEKLIGASCFLWACSIYPKSVVRIFDICSILLVYFHLTSRAFSGLNNQEVGGKEAKEDAKMKNSIVQIKKEGHLAS